MKLYFDSNLRIDLPQQLFINGKVKDRTKRYGFSKKKSVDVERKMGILKEMSKKVGPQKVIYDIMAGCGFSASIISKYTKPTKLYLNDFNQDCAEHLQTTFPKATVTCGDVIKLPLQKMDLIFIDFSAFSLKTISKWKDFFTCICQNTQYLWITDITIFSFNFGDLRITRGWSCNACGTNSLQEYYSKIAHYFWEQFGMVLENIGSWKNASLLCFTKKEVDTLPEIAYVTAPAININYRKGFQR